MNDGWHLTEIFQGLHANIVFLMSEPEQPADCFTLRQNIHVPVMWIDDQRFCVTASWNTGHSRSTFTSRCYGILKLNSLDVRFRNNSTPIGDQKRLSNSKDVQVCSYGTVIPKITNVEQGLVVHRGGTNIFPVIISRTSKNPLASIASVGSQRDQIGRLSAILMRPQNPRVLNRRDQS